MIAQTVSNIKLLTNLLFLKDNFDHFLVSEVSISTGNTFHIEGDRNKAFYSEEELADMNGECFSSWESLRPFCFSIIKGRKLPLSFKIVLRLSYADTQELISHAETPIPVEVDGLFLNIMYRNESITCVSGTAYKEFTMDRTADHLWDQTVTQFLDTILGDG